MEEQKNELEEEDISFTATNPIDALFNSWSTLISSQSKQNTTADPTETNSSENLKSTNYDWPNMRRSFIASSRLYVNDAFIDIYNKNDVTRSKRFAKMFKRLPFC